ncbi:hypothetical protein GCM10027590_25050 [Nocardiopsis nanhaiensis]
MRARTGPGARSFQGGGKVDSRGIAFFGIFGHPPSKNPGQNSRDVSAGDGWGVYGKYSLGVRLVGKRLSSLTGKGCPADE